MKPTSIKSYHEILPKLSERRRQVYELIKIMEPCTAKAVQDRMERELKISGAWKRFSELQAMGLIKPFGEGHDPDTKMLVTLWRTVPNPKINTNKPLRMTRRQVLEAQLERYKAKVLDTTLKLSSLALMDYKKIGSEKPNISTFKKSDRLQTAPDWRKPNARRTR